MGSGGDFALDIEELRQLQSIAKRPRVLSLLSTEIRNLEKLSKEAAPAIPQAQAPIAAVNAPTPVTSAPRPAAPNQVLQYTPLGTFSWDQDAENLKIYISIEGVDREKVVADFKPTSFDIKLHDVQGKNYRFSIPKLHKEIVPEKCKFIVKPKRVVVTLGKASVGNWLDLNFKEDKLKPNLEKERDPMAGIMDLMKNMYEEGDDEMKRTIAKAWSDARSGKTADTLPSLR